MVNENNKFVPTAPQTYEVRFVEQQDLYPDLGYNDINETRGYGPCSQPGCTHTFNLKVDITNSSGVGIGFSAGQGRTVVYLNSVSEARAFIDQVKGEWVVDKGKWSPSSSSGVGSITSGKRQTVAKNVEAQIDSFERGNSIDTTLYHS